MPDWGGNSLYILISAVLAWAVSHAFFWRCPWLRSANVHQGFKYGATLIGGIALIGTISKSNVQIAEWRYTLLDDRVTGLRGQVESAVQSGIDIECGLKFVRSADSPANFDDIVRRQHAACEIFRTWRSTLAKDRSELEKPIVLPTEQLAAVSDPWSDATFSFVKNRISEYNQVADQRRRLRAEAMTGPLDITIALFGPYLAIAALMVALATIMFPARAGP